MTFQEGNIIRNKKSGHPYLVCYINAVCILVVDIKKEGNPISLFAILPRDYSKYARDIDMNCYAVKRSSYWMDEKLIFTLAQKIRM